MGTKDVLDTMAIWCSRNAIRMIDTLSYSLSEIFLKFHFQSFVGMVQGLWANGLTVKISKLRTGASQSSGGREVECRCLRILIKFVSPSIPCASNRLALNHTLWRDKAILARKPQALQLPALLQTRAPPAQALQSRYIKIIESSQNSDRVKGYRPCRGDSS
jgi:hypothetical protein